MSRPHDISRFALYGERESALAPEFVHIETISQRSRLYEGTIAPHAHPGIFQLLLLEAGSGVLATDGEEARLRPGALVALPTGCVHAFRFAGDAEGWVLSVAATLLNDPRIAALCRVAAVPGAPPRWLQLDERAHARLAWLLADLAEALAGNRSGLLADATAARLALVLALVEENQAAGERASQLRQHGGRRTLLARRFRELVELHFRGGWDVAAYARALSTTPPTLTRSCREALGKAPGEVVLDRVLLEAMRNLTYSAAPVSQIAGDLGFADSAYFARFFKARSGMTASVFRHQRAWIARG
jgi:AraC family transcriptional activator of pobA